ncbi:MAG: hypothetical protein O3A74_00975 [archaeon]|nr:hypothetical protein [archaeon]
MSASSNEIVEDWLNQSKLKDYNDHNVSVHAPWGKDFKRGADAPVSASQIHVAQLEATIRSAHALLQVGLIEEATSLLAAFSTEVQPKLNRELTEVRSNVDRTLPNAERW